MRTFQLERSFKISSIVKVYYLYYTGLGEWGNWSEYSKCDCKCKSYLNQCSSEQTRTRKCKAISDNRILNNYDCKEDVYQERRNCSRLCGKLENKR